MPDDKLYDLGKQLRWSDAFPKGANVNFCRIAGEDYIIAKTFERGVEDFTLACGTGASSLVAALTLMGKVSGENVKVDMPGGQLEISLTVEGESVKDIFLTGKISLKILKNRSCQIMISNHIICLCKKQETRFRF